ncbi:putative secreted protein [Wickerhamomyces ciferrii]|uniref:Secreted protein n=1 Tax=Wickerhamomyces ciferrii (strain ATCC 14091 / BCRC 22168 / CBS 111 / JCM 3599 / NBRC 0793 / NRRL Y-1031 F-60-10) TaxID=1206466 RepID=K0KME7_WICCF|nr:uncharacterized protein BN7_2098 [Wickerhamomyces ciferrii]CCH42554.1 putative secreted protein [Wickerhamomyces ciferrii]
MDMILALRFLQLLTGAVAFMIQQQPHISPPKNSHFRDLVWGDLNFIHTTDTHGWLAGHLNQKQYSADWGDFISFTTNLHEIANAKGKDLLLIDTGDKHDGNGLSDATRPNGRKSTPIFNKQNYDLVTIGNHELYYEDYSIQEFEVSVKRYGEHYVSSNVEFKTDNGQWQPFGSKYRYFETKNQRYRVLSLSFLFDFKRFNSRTKVFPIKEAIEQNWFKNVTSTFTQDDLDFIIIFGHIPVTDLEHEELLYLHIRLRRIYPKLIIHYFGGHSHIRDYSILDHKAAGLQSGRYCETVGWASVNITDYDHPKFTRKYIDFNRESFIHHSFKSKSNFDTDEGLEVSRLIKDTRKKLNLTFSFGYVPKNYMLNEHQYGHPTNLYTFLNSSILPTLENTIDRDVTKTNRIILINSGSIRYDLYKGNFTTDTQFTISPFENSWNFIKLHKDLAFRLESYLNDQAFFMTTNELASPEKTTIGFKLEQRDKFDQLLIDQKQSHVKVPHHSCPFVKESYLKKGQTTSDDLGCNGDDVSHNSIQYHPSPNVVQTYQEFVPGKEDVDVVFYSFIEPYLISAINLLNHRHKVLERNITSSDIQYYGGESTGTLLRQYVQNHWS